MILLENQLATTLLGNAKGLAALSHPPISFPIFVGGRVMQKMRAIFRRLTRNEGARFPPI